MGSRMAIPKVKDLIQYLLQVLRKRKLEENAFGRKKLSTVYLTLSSEYSYNVAQTRTKFKRCVSICRNALLKAKITSGIKIFQKDQELGACFNKLLSMVKTMDSCQPEESIEPDTICSSSSTSSISMEGSSSKNKRKQLFVSIH